MEDQEVMVEVRDFGRRIGSSIEKAAQQVSSVRESENLGVDLLEDLDSYWEDINDRLMISRMVSDSVIKGMVKAVEQRAEEKIAAKELEVESLKEKMHLFQLGADKSESCHEARSQENGFYCSFSDAFVEHDKMTESLGSLRDVAKGQIKKLKMETDSIRGCSPMRRISSGSEFVGLGGILQEKAPESFTGVDNLFETLKTTMDNIYAQLDDMVHLTRASLCEWKLEQELQKEVEAVVIQNSIRSFCKEYEEKLWEQNTRLERINEVSNLRKELDAILNSVSNPENGQLISHGSLDMDHLHKRGLSNHFSPSTSLWEGNGVFEESNNGMPESWDAAQLKHMSKDELVNYFNSMITRMRRSHESKVQQMTEEFFSLKGEYLREKGYSLAHRKDKDLENLRKKIPDVILKLDDFIMENEKLSTLGSNAETLRNLKNRIDSLLSENRNLRDSLADQRKEVKCLSLQVSDAAEKMCKHILAEANLPKLTEDLKSDLEDAATEASATEKVCKCFLRKVTPKNNCGAEELEMQPFQVPKICEIEDSDIESLVIQGICGVIFKETVKDAQSNIDELTKKYSDEYEKYRVSLESKALERKEELSLVIEEKERLKQEVRLLQESLEEKENLVTERVRELDLVKSELELALEQIEADKGTINRLDQKVELMTKEVRETNEHRNMLLAITEEKQNDWLLLQAKENEHRKQMQAVIVLIGGLSRGLSDFEVQVSEGIRNCNMRLEGTNSQLSSLVRKSNSLKNTALLYKKRLERRCNDLQMAEAEVDLLGDEVDALLSLLEKIYIALDHYSPIFQHYPGVIEILKLVRRELSRESTKSI
ncbi:WPP domain-associated protein [Rhododendron vialii]|uniref:WPP domain-associated protein n=1 Tax=Rhododendron vialii TaxID=182163 RepID=UPI00265DCE9B|nr:WPP domain-associated protein [Rhododendron vialii]XP_058196961.1 WPP domain-associated protein [Rhododendron vialii]XP_058196962.1 WPP domain-associated protein [Rhododendron vialii]